MGRIAIFIAGVAAGAAMSALAGERSAVFGVSVQVVPTGAVSLSASADGPVLSIGGERVRLEGDGSAVATVEY
jgi:hypothetical protein